MFRIVLAKQDITAVVDEPTISVESNLGTGAGVMAGTSGRATTCQFEAWMGPLATAPGAGQFVAPPPRNLLTPNQSSAATDLTGFSTAIDGLLSGNVAATAVQDFSTAWIAPDGTAYPSIHVNSGALTSGPSGVEISPGVAVAAGVTVTVSFYLYTTGSGGALRLRDFTNGTTPYAGVSTPNNAPQWTRIVYTFTTTQASTDLRFAWRTNTANQDAWIAGLQLELNPSASTWVLGGSEAIGTTLVRQGELVVYDDNGNRVFGGYLTNMDDRTKKPPKVKTLCKGVDYWTHLDRVTVTKTYDGVSDTAAIQDLMTTYAPSVNTSAVNFNQSNITLYKQVFRGKSLQATLQHIADITGFDLWVDATNALHYQKPSSEGNAPFSISDAPDFLNSYGASITQHGLDDNGTINRVTFVGGSHPTSDFTQNISSQANGANTTFVLAYSPHESSDGHIHVKVNGVDQVVGFVLTTSQLKSQGGTCDVLIDRSKGVITFNTAPATGASVTCLYRYQTPLVVVVTNQQSFSFFGTWFDGLIVDQTVFDTTTALARCRTLLSAQAMGLERITLQLYQPGLQAGMQLRVDNALRAIHTVYRIQSVVTQWLGGDQFRYTVQAGAWDWKVADVLLAAARFSQQADQNFDELNVSIQALELVSNAGVHDSWTIHTRTSGAYYARATAVGDGHDAYPGLCTITS